MFLLAQADAPYAALAQEMNTSEGALKVAIHRLRKRYRELFCQEIADTVADPTEVESELRFLATVLTRKSPRWQEPAVKLRQMCYKRFLAGLEAPAEPGHPLL